MKIIVLDGFTLNPGDLSWESIETLGETTIYDRTPAESIVERARDAEILITNKTPLDKTTLDALPHLKYIGVLATGYNVVDVEAARSRGIPVSNIPSYGTASVAQATFALLLELCNRIKDHDDAVKRGEWSSAKDFCFWNHPLFELSGKTMGIIGFGHIGQNVADIATAFGMKVMAFSRSRSDQSARKDFQWAELDELLSSADVVSLHCPLFDSTRGMINRHSLGLMKKTAFLINTSRGALINETDLAEALNHQRIAGAALDVLSTEPPPSSNPLLAAKNCLVTPHIAWASLDARKRLMAIAGQNIKAWLAGVPENIVNP